MAILFAILGILLYISVRFKHFDFGFSAVVALFHYVLVALAFLLFFSYKIDLFTVTALLTIAGYSINDTIVVYDRIRELRLRLSKESLPQVINTALNLQLDNTTNPDEDYATIAPNTANLIGSAGDKVGIMLDSSVDWDHDNGNLRIDLYVNFS